MKPVDEILDQCSNVLPGHGRRRSMKEVFQELADALDGDEYPDTYGNGSYLNDFEAEIAALFGKEAAVFMPSGTMAQQIAMRIWSEQRKNSTIAMHPTAHLEYAEYLGYQFLHHLTRLQFGAPELLRNRLLTAKDFDSLGQEPGAILIELPYRPLGGQLPSWDELLAIRVWAAERGIPCHLDGARIWQCRPFYQRPYHEIADLFDSIYVSFYKDLGGLCGAMLIGSRSFVQEARVWQRRHGGSLRTQGPFVASARLGFQKTLPQIDDWVARAQEVASILSEIDGVTVHPYPPHVNCFQLYIRGDSERLNRKHQELAQETGTFVFYSLNPSPVPGIAMTEIHLWENAMAFVLDQLQPFMRRLLGENE